MGGAKCGCARAALVFDKALQLLRTEAIEVVDGALLKLGADDELSLIHI